MKFELKDYKRQCLSSLLNCGSRDIFCTQPTGSGKSLIYQLFPFALDFCQARKIERDPKGIKTNNIVLIVSPLISLMKDQIAKLEHFGITAINLAEAKDAQNQTTTIERRVYLYIWQSRGVSFDRIEADVKIKDV